MSEKKDKIINEVDLLKENQNFLKTVMAGIRIRMQVSLQRNGGHIKKWQLVTYYNRNKTIICLHIIYIYI